jgi:predicted transcriptional regulator
MTIHDFGSRVKEVREQVLNLKQSEFAENFGINQSMMSRLESGAGGNISLVFEIVSYLQKIGLPAHLLFRENFSIEEFKEIALAQPNKDVKDVIEKLQSSLQSSMKEVIRLENIILK